MNSNIRKIPDRFDFKGRTPESWDCIDCSINTAPGFPSRVEMERLYKTSVVMQKLSRAEPSSMTVATYTFNEHCEVYTVRDSVWKAAGMEPMGGCICIGCLEKRLGRKLNPKGLPAPPSIQFSAWDRAAHRAAGAIMKEERERNPAGTSPLASPAADRTVLHPPTNSNRRSYP